VENNHRILWGDTLGRLINIWEDNIKMIIRQTGCEDAKRMAEV